MSINTDMNLEYDLALNSEERSKVLETIFGFLINPKLYK